MIPWSFESKVDDGAVILDLKGSCALHSLSPPTETNFFHSVNFLAFPLVFPGGIKTKSMKGVDPSCLETCLLCSEDILRV